LVGCVLAALDPDANDSGRLTEVKLVPVNEERREGGVRGGRVDEERDLV
jgi:hypothetical protein